MENFQCFAGALCYRYFSINNEKAYISGKYIRAASLKIHSFLKRTYLQVHKFKSVPTFSVCDNLYQFSLSTIMVLSFLCVR